MGNLNKKNLEARHRKFEGFGQAHSVPKWAELAGIPRNSMWRYLTQYGLTVEEVYELRGIPAPECKTV